MTLFRDLRQQGRSMLVVPSVITGALCSGAIAAYDAYLSNPSNAVVDGIIQLFAPLLVLIAIGYGAVAMLIASMLLLKHIIHLLRLVDDIPLSDDDFRYVRNQTLTWSVIGLPIVLIFLALLLSVREFISRGLPEDLVGYFVQGIGQLVPYVIGISVILTCFGLRFLSTLPRQT